MRNYETRLNLAALALRAVGGHESAKACEEAAKYIRDLLPKPCYCDEHQGTHIRCPVHGSQADGDSKHG